jgi:hypothetical protein
MIESFSIKIPEQAIEDLKMRLRRTRWTDEILNSGWNYGADLSYVKEITDYWLNTLKAKSKIQYHLLLHTVGPVLFWK